MQRLHEDIMKVIYDQYAISPLQTLGIDDLAGILHMTRDELWNELAYLREKGFIAITEHQVGTRIFYSLHLTTIGVDYVEQGMFTVPKKVDISISPTSIFISHSRFDGDFCFRMLEYLNKHLPSADIFYDALSLYAGDEWVRRIPQEIIRRPTFVVVLSPHATESPWVIEEVTLAIREAVKDKQRRIVSVLYQACDINEISPFLRSRQLINCVDQKEDAALGQLLLALTQ